MPDVFEDNDIVANNSTTSHLNDNFMSLCTFCACIELGEPCGPFKTIHLNDKGYSR